MIPQPGPASAYRPSFQSHVHVDGDICPFCEQEIPPEKLEEISGRIATRERERESAIRSALEQNHAIERAESEARARETLALERQRSAAREAEAKESVELVANKKLAVAEREQQALQAALREQAEESQTAKAASEKIQADLTSRIQAIQQESAAALASARSEAAARENQIRAEAEQAAEKSQADKYAALESARQTEQAEFQTKIASIEETRRVAEQHGETLKQQIDALAMAKDVEVAQLKEKAIVEAVRIRADATEAAQSQVQQQLADKDSALVAEKAKTELAENQIALLAQQHQLTMQQQLDTQRETLEKAKDEAVSAEKSRAFEENQKLSTKVSELQRALEKKSNEELGEGAEINLFEALKVEFPDDDIQRVAKGAAGADIIHIVMHNRRPCGTIVYDSKNHLAFRSDHVTKLRADQVAQKAEHAILSLHKFPENTRQLHVRDGVLLANPARVVTVAGLLRGHLVQVYTLRISATERESKTVALYDFIISDRYTQLLTRIDMHADDLLDQQVKEKKQHDAMWKKNGELVRLIQKASADIAAEVSAIIGTAAEPEELCEPEEIAKELS